jgi:hypothetical protein
VEQFLGQQRSKKLEKSQDVAAALHENQFNTVANCRESSAFL